MKTLQNQSDNSVTIIGKLLSVNFRNRKTKAGIPYESADLIVRVSQNVSGVEEIEEIPVKFFVQQFNSKGVLSSKWKNIQDLHQLRTAQDHGYELASNVRIQTGTIDENIYLTRSGTIMDVWQVNVGFVNEGANSSGEKATFDIEIFILDKSPEYNRDGEETGRLLIKGATVKYNGEVQVLQFIVEDPDYVEYIDKHWEVNNTVHAIGRIRVTSKEEKPSGKRSSWGEDIETTSTKLVHELLITGGDDDGADEDFAYDPAEIRKGFNARKARIEAMQMTTQEQAATKKSPEAKYNWE